MRSMPDAKLQRCFEMLTKAQDDFIFLQKTRGNENRHLEINPFLVRIMLENSARIIKYGNRRMVIKIKAEQRLCFDSSVAYLRQILHQLMRALSNSDMLELEGAVVSRDGVLKGATNGTEERKETEERPHSATNNLDLLRLGVKCTFHLDIHTVQERRPDLVAFGLGGTVGVHGGLLDIVRRVGTLGGRIVSTWEEMEYRNEEEEEEGEEEEGEVKEEDVTGEAAGKNETLEYNYAGATDVVVMANKTIGGGESNQQSLPKTSTTFTVHVWVPSGIGSSIRFNENDHNNGQNVPDVQDNGGRVAKKCL